MRSTAMFLKGLVFAAAIFMCNVISAQDVVIQDSSDQVTKEEVPSEANSAYAHWDYTSIGIGGGLDYGGLFGVNFTQYLGEPFGLFGGVGYNMDKLGYNLGVKLRLHQMFDCKKSAPFLVAMYGYNAVAVIQNSGGGMEKSKTFYGPTYGIGFDYRSTAASTSYWTFSILFPVRSSAVHDYFEEHDATETFSLPFAISIGYRISLN